MVSDEISALPVVSVFRMKEEISGDPGLKL